MLDSVNQIWFEGEEKNIHIVVVGFYMLIVSHPPFTHIYTLKGNGRGAKHPSTLTALSMLADITAMPNTKRAIGSAVRLYKRCIGLRKRGSCSFACMLL
jgi:hypothetical protein